MVSLNVQWCIDNLPTFKLNKRFCIQGICYALYTMIIFWTCKILPWNSYHRKTDINVQKYINNWTMIYPEWLHWYLDCYTYLYCSVLKWKWIAFDFDNAISNSISPYGNCTFYAQIAMGKVYCIKSSTIIWNLPRDINFCATFPK